ncbi:MAG: class II aldolase/adducin family protein [Firmicutes bacterium]|jgi:L-fuculose-phosphate aldolase|nr:class II aldolase/adducin family protein [Bacillota bacterium]HOB21344.1 class II aldolase/adducin family protein [Bacillota bacterium]HQD39702.1 class II aldolase/adducin family protein [Bacillota bacterium]
MRSEFQLKEDICEVGRRIYQNGYVAANDGNITVRIGENEVLTTPTGVSKGFMNPQMIIKVNMDGEVLSGDLKPSSELKMHLRVYKERPDVRSVIHAHPPTATGFAVAGIPLVRCILPEVIISLGSIPIAEYGTPSTEEIPDAIMKYLTDCDAVLLANHGALTVGTDLFNAYFKMETLEHFAKISLVARQLGGEQELPKEQVKKLYEVREKLGVKGRNPGCQSCGACDLEQTEDHAEESLREMVKRITRRVLSELDK